MHTSVMCGKGIDKVKFLSRLLKFCCLVGQYSFLREGSIGHYFYTFLHNIMVNKRRNHSILVHRIMRPPMPQYQVRIWACAEAIGYWHGSWSIIDLKCPPFFKWAISKIKAKMTSLHFFGHTSLNYDPISKIEKQAYSLGPPLSIDGSLDAFWRSGSVREQALFGALEA